MITDFLGGTDWDSPPPEMEMALPYSSLIDKVRDCVLYLGEREREPKDWARLSASAVTLYAMVPGIVNVMLNYKICVEHDLPLHPTVYYELKEARKYRIDHGLPAVDKANRLFRRSITLARSALRLDPDFPGQASEFLGQLPAELASFIYTGIRDTYTWRGSDPEILGRLSAKVAESYSPDIIVAAAHGSIMPGLLLAELLRLPLYFIRFSMFKRNDEEPIVTFSDEAWLYDFKDGKALLYDEDVAGGRTLTEFSRRVGPLFSECRTACSIRHAGANIKPDFCGKVWWD